VKERPILFSGAMVRALLAATKTQTRRTVTPRNSMFNGGPWSKWAKATEKAGHFDWPSSTVDAGPSPAGNPGPYLHLPYAGPDRDWQGTRHRIYPRIQPGDPLWVRETHHFDPPDDGTWAYTAWAGCEESTWRDIPARFQKPEHVIHAATWTHSDLVWRPSIHMPRWASRITLEVTRVRVERLQEISSTDALAEGIQSYDAAESGCKGAYRDLWEQINGAGSWDANPWVWVVEFRRLP
jgi:hypothetical protein